MLELNPKTIAAMAPTMERVLVVDPAPASARLLADLLHNIWPGQVWNGPNTVVALQMAQNLEPRLIFVEHTGGEVDGLEFTRQLRRSNFSCRMAPVIMVTAQATPAVILGARDSGVHEFLRKPFTNKDLIRRLEAVTLHPRSWIEAVGYVGPDRRRFNSADYKGARKRKVDAAANPEQARLVQAVRIIAAAAEALDKDPAQAERALRTQAMELQRLAPSFSAMGLPAIANSLTGCLNEAGRAGAIDRAELAPHVTALIGMLPKDDPAGVRTAA